LQGGTLGNSTTGSDSSLSKIKGEFSSNDVDNPLADSFGRGTVAMARTTDVDSASSTFFVTLSSSKSVQSTLNGQYAAFGTIDEEGMQIVDQIVLDYASYADDNMGGISDESKQAHITGIVMVD
jgi:cyclophilin family peptidyl-prolyl cis-trans isomerase